MDNRIVVKSGVVRRIADNTIPTRVTLNRLLRTRRITKRELAITLAIGIKQ